MSVSPVNILCMKWGNKYGAVYVNRLHAMVSRNLSRPFRFICLTDDSSGFSDGIESFEIPEVPVDMSEDPAKRKVQAWKKLLTFVDPLYDIQGTCLFLDLDIVIIDSIDCFFEPKGEFFIIQDWAGKRDTGNSSVYRFTAGAHSDLVQYFCDHRDNLVEKFGNEQNYLTTHMQGQDKLQFWSDDWCMSYRKQVLPSNRLARWFFAAKKPSYGKIIVFHGDINPEGAIAGQGDRWYRRIRPAKWLADYWC